MIQNGIRSSVPGPLQDRYLIRLEEGKNELKKTATCNEKPEADAYGLGLRARAAESYEVTFAVHGDCAPAGYPQIQELVQLLPPDSK